jgi:hypothetical protein
MVCRPFLDEPSTLERIVAKATEAAPPRDDKAYFEILSHLMDEEIQNVAQERF